MATKEQWPELVGKTSAEAEEAVKHDRPDVKVEILKDNSPTTMDYRVDRVRIFTNDAGVVTGPPCTG